MTGDPENLQTILTSMRAAIELPFWRRSEFWISFIATAGGLFFSLLAFLEARKAKRAATEAGKIVKIQTITIELTEIAQKLSKMDTDIRFDEARDLLTEISRRVRRTISAFQKDPDLSEAIINIRDALAKAKVSLNSARPTDPTKESDIPNAVYFAIESDFAVINDFVADLLGLFEGKTMDLGDDNAK